MLFSNCMEAVESIYALLKIGAVVVPLNIRLSSAEMEYVADQSDVISECLRMEAKTMGQIVRITCELLFKLEVPTFS